MNSEKLKEFKIKTFGTTDIQYNEKSIFLEKHIDSKTVALLRYFIINRDIPCKAEKIIEDLWPDNDYIDEKKVLQTYIHRLRNMFTKENSFKTDFSAYINIIHKGGGYQLNLSEDTEIDADVFLAVIGEAVNYENYNDLMETVRSLQSIYAGHFMIDGAHNHVIIKQQNYYRREYCSAVAIILSKLTELGEYNDIINICESFFIIDDLNESINYMFMKALIKTGQVSHAIKHYDFITKKMRDIMDIGPSSDMQMLYKSIKKESTKITYDSAPEKHDSTANPDNIYNMFRSIVDEIIAERLDNKKAMYSVLKLVVTDPSDQNDYTDIFETVMLRSLRIRDIYAVLDKHTSIAILYGITDKAHEMIKKRITDCFYKIAANTTAEIKLTIMPAYGIE